MSIRSTGGWSAAPGADSGLASLLKGLCAPESSLGRAAHELLAEGCLQPVTVRTLLTSGLGLADLAAVVARASERPQKLPERAGRVQVRAIAYLVSRLSRLEGLLPGEALDEALGVALVRALVTELIPIPKGRDPHAPRRRALSELLAWGEVGPEARALLKPADDKELRRLLASERSLILQLAPSARRERLAAVLTAAFQEKEAAR